MKGKEGSGDPEGREAKSRLALSGRGLDTSGEKGFFADEDRQDVGVRVRMVSRWMALGNAKSAREFEPTLRPDSRFAFRRYVLIRD